VELAQRKFGFAGLGFEQIRDELDGLAAQETG
jgi:hypothetical protein